MEGKSFFIDLSKCTACRGCQIACKQWHKLPTEKTKNRGSHQNPEDLSFWTYKLVRFNEVLKNGKLTNWLFFPDQCRHCITPPCKSTADIYDEQAILKDERTGAVIFTEHTKNVDAEDVRMSCPYNIPRKAPESDILGKCDMCLDRVQNGLLPACVATCPTGAMSFGDREEIMEMADKRLKEVKKHKPEAMLADSKEVRVIYLLEEKPEDYYEYTVASLSRPNPWTRKELLAKAFSPIRQMTT
ncbi:MAG: 4Fe-4S dicluster domain-containing protein [Desulfohalobiaceae bacterium]